MIICWRSWSFFFLCVRNSFNGNFSHYSNSILWDSCCNCDVNFNVKLLRVLLHIIFLHTYIAFQAFEDFRHLSDFSECITNFEQDIFTLPHFIITGTFLTYCGEINMKRLQIKFILFFSSVKTEVINSVFLPFLCLFVCLLHI